MTPQPQSQQRESRVVWFEIPAADMDRACQFYETVLGTKLNRGQFCAETLGVFPYEKPAITRCLQHKPDHRPAPDGTVIYLNANPDLDGALDRVAAAGGK